MASAQKLIGQSVARREDYRFLTGTGRYLADIRPTGALQLAVVRSTVPAGRIERIDTTAAAAADGVFAVFTGADLADEVGPIPLLTVPDARFAEAFSLRSDPPSVPCIAVDQVRYVGEPVALVVATDRYLAEDAAELVEVSYEPWEPVLDAAAATTPGARAVHPENPDNIALSVAYGKGELAEPGDGHVVIERRYHMGRSSGVPLEGRGVLAEPNGPDSVDVWTSTQIPYRVRESICAATGWSEDSVRVRTPDVGGGFGVKANVYGEEILVPVLARRLGRAVVWVEDRYEHLISAAQSRDQTHRCRLVVDRDGRILSWEDDFDVDIGAHNLWMAGVVANTAIHLLGAYRIPACRISGRAVFTNKAPTTQFRGAGRPEATFALERSLDEAARRLGISRGKFRALNILTAADLPYPQGIPYRDGKDIVYDGRDYAAVLQACLDLVPEEQIRDLTDHEQAAGRLVGVGLATFVEATGRGPYEYAKVRLADDGRVLVEVGTASAGMSHETTLAQIAGDALGRPLDAVLVHSGDTAGVPHSIGTFASRTAVVAGSAVHQACELLCEQARTAVARTCRVDLDAVTPTSQGFAVRDGPVIGWEALAQWFTPDGALADEAPLEAIGRFAPETVTWTMGAHLAVVSVDPATGLIKVLRYATADEAGVPINPKIVEGQVKGGVAQGIGGALLEEFRYDTSAQPTSTTFAEYLLPGTGDIPAVDVAHVEVPSTRNALGLKGVGESGTIAGYAVIASAVEDALRAFDVEVLSTPIRPQDVRTWLRSAGL